MVIVVAVIHAHRPPTKAHSRDACGHVQGRAGGRKPEKAAGLILLLWDKVEKLTEIVAAQGREIELLKSKLAKSRKNSSKPPSSDKSNPGGRPPSSPKAGRGGQPNRPGGQKGHRGTALEKRATPDHIVELPGPALCGCGHKLSRVAPTRYISRQVHDLPKDIKIEVTEYRAPVCECPGCGKKATTRQWITVPNL